MKFLILSSFITMILCSLARAETISQTIESAEVMGMSRFRGHWDTPLPLDPNGPTEAIDEVLTERGASAVWKPGTPGPIAFDALNRSILVRFPDAAEQIAAKVAEGYGIEKIEVVLPFKDEELWPIGRRDWPGPYGYDYRMNFGVEKLYREVRPQWHAIAWALRKPWHANAETGPTFNAAINGALYWEKFGAQDTEEDRFPEQYGPAEVSYKVPYGQLDITKAIIDPEKGTLAENLRIFADCGLLIKKWESYDHRFYRDVYEWATATGGRAILIDTPKLIVTYKPAEWQLTPLPEPADLATLNGGTPTALMPKPEDILQAGRYFEQPPEWASESQWERVVQLAELKPGVDASTPIWFLFTPKHLIEKTGKIGWQDDQKIWVKPPDPYKVYEAWVDATIGRQPRGWGGFEASLEMAQWYVAGNLLPAPAQEAFLEYWTHWIMADRESSSSGSVLSLSLQDGTLVHPMIDKIKNNDPLSTYPLDSYYLATGDWRGNKSFYRSGFTNVTSTQNFNTTASIGALLGGNILDSERGIADGLRGFEKFLLRQWNWDSGSSQEHIDHYYYAVSMKGYKALYDYLNDPLENLMTTSLMTKANQELITTYHPNLKRYIAGSSRTSLAYLLGKQDGLNYIMHTIMDEGALTDTDGAKLPENIPAFGQELTPEQVAMQTLKQPWMPDWQANFLNHREFPYSATLQAGKAIRSIYLGENYGISSDDRSTRRVQIMGQWRRNSETVDSMRDLTTMYVKSGYNNTRFASDAPGWINAHGSESAYQKDNKLIVISSPRAYQGGLSGSDWIDDLKRFQSSIAFFNYEDPVPSWKLYINGEAVTELPAYAQPGQHILIHDGVTYFAATPLPGPKHLPGQGQVIIEAGKPQTSNHTKLTHTPALVINYTMFAADQPLARDGDWHELDQSFAAFAIELGDETEYRSFENFREHILNSTGSASFDPATLLATAQYNSGGEKMEFSTLTARRKEADGKWDSKLAGNVQSRKHNDTQDTLPASVMLSTPNTSIAWGNTELAGAEVHAYPVTGKDKRTALQYDPISDTYEAWNPLPDLTAWHFTAPGGYEVRSDGAISITQVLVHRKAKELHIRHPWKDDQTNHPSAASAMLLHAPADTKIVFNGSAFEVSLLEQRRLQGKDWWILPLRGAENLLPADVMEQRLQQIESYPTPDVGWQSKSWFNDVWYAGPFPAEDIAFGPEREFIATGDIDLDKTYPEETHPDYVPESQYPAAAHWRVNRTKPKPFGDMQNGSIHASSNGHPYKLDPKTTENAYYILLTAKSDRKQSAGLYHTVDGDGDTREQLWVNGAPVALTSQSKGMTPITLKQGDNKILIRITQVGTRRWGDKVGIKIGDPVFGTPMIEGVHWIGSDGTRYPISPTE